MLPHRIMDWYYASNGQQQGPVTQEQLLELFRLGQISSSDLVWNETMTDWVAFGSVPELAATTSPVEAATPEEAQPPAMTPSEQTPQMTPAPVQPLPAGTVPSYLWQSIACVVLCCWPLAIPAIISAVKVNPALLRGDLAAAEAASANAKKWVTISAVAGVLAGIVYFALMLFGGLADSGAF